MQANGHEVSAVSLYSFISPVPSEMSYSEQTHSTVLCGLSIFAVLTYPPFQTCLGWIEKPTNEGVMKNVLIFFHIAIMKNALCNL